MSRPSKYSVDQILDAALCLFDQQGRRAVSVAAIARKISAPSGSIYHRFASRDVLLATLWLREVEQFQQGFFDALMGEDAHLAALDSALYVLDWARKNTAKARLLLLYRRHDLIAGKWPEEVSTTAERVSRKIPEGLIAFAERAWPGASIDVALLAFALTGIPYAAAREPLAMGRPIPRSLDAAVAAAVDAVLLLVPSSSCQP